MNINPMEIMKLKNSIAAFDSRHPKLKRFFANISKRIDTGCVLEISLTDTDGKKVRTNFVVSPEDKELLGALTNMF